MFFIFSFEYPQNKSQFWATYHVSNLEKYNFSLLESHNTCDILLMGKNDDLFNELNEEFFSL